MEESIPVKEVVKVVKLSSLKKSMERFDSVPSIGTRFYEEKWYPCLLYIIPRESGGWDSEQILIDVPDQEFDESYKARDWLKEYLKPKK